MQHPVCLPNAIEDMYTEKKRKKKKEEEEENEDDTNRLKELEYNGCIAALMTTVCFLYGKMTVASQLPPDPRQEGWILMWSATPTLLLTYVYILLVTCIGPRFMKNRGPVQGLRPLMTVYNALQVLYSGWIFTEAGVTGWFGRYTLWCQQCDFSDDPYAVRMMIASYWYYFSKLVDFTDTVFFVLNKKYEHISLLHVSHHALMPVSMWFGQKHQPGGHMSMFGFLNAFVHTVMYAYYFLAAMGPRVRPFLWWKRYLTNLQMLQFTCIFLHAMLVSFVDCPLPVPVVLVRWVGFLSAMFFVLFIDFYIKAYYEKRKNQNAAKSPSETGARPRYTDEGLTQYALRDIPKVRPRHSQSNGSASGSSPDDAIFMRHSINSSFS